MKFNINKYWNDYAKFSEECADEIIKKLNDLILKVSDEKPTKSIKEITLNITEQEIEKK